MRTEPSFDWARGPVVTLMTRDVVSVNASDPMATVRRSLEGAPYHHLLVVDDGRLVGTIGTDNLALAAVMECAPHGHACTARDAMTREPTRARPECSLAAAARMMLDHRVSVLPVVDEGGALLGIVTQTDLLRALAARIA